MGTWVSNERCLETWIHSEIYRARPDAHTIVHSHSPSVIPFAASSVRLRPVYHMAGFLRSGSPVSDIHHCFGCTDMLVRNGVQGKALADTLGDADVAPMRGHGFVALWKRQAAARQTQSSVPVDMLQIIFVFGEFQNFRVQGRVENHTDG